MPCGSSPPRRPNNSSVSCRSPCCKPFPPCPPPTPLSQDTSACRSPPRTGFALTLGLDVHYSSPHPPNPALCVLPCPPIATGASLTPNKARPPSSCGGGRTPSPRSFSQRSQRPLPLAPCFAGATAPGGSKTSTWTTANFPTAATRTASSSSASRISTRAPSPPVP